MIKLTAILFLLSTSMLSHSLDIKLACKESKEQNKALLSKLSTSLKEANLAGQCKGYYDNDFSLYEVCEEYTEQKNNLLGALSTSLDEANKSGVCMGAIYAVCENSNITQIAERIIDRDDRLIRKVHIRNTVGCNG